jgi:hypothetical protein
MRSIKLWRASALTAALVLAGVSVAQPPGQKGGVPKGFGQPARVSVDDIVERIMAFDKNKDGKVSRDELPERMHHLIALGDTNKDGALDREEIRKLANTLATALGEFGGRPAFGPKLRVDGGVRVGPGPGPGGVDIIEGVVDDLKLTGKKRDQAMAAVKAHQEHLRKVMDQARGDLLQKMKGILSEEEWKDFQAALDRPRGATFFSVGPPDALKKKVEKKFEQPQK